MGERDRLEWITRAKNPANPLTKPILSTKSTIYNITENSTFQLEPDGYKICTENKYIGVSMISPHSERASCE